MPRTASFLIPLGCVMASLGVVAACEDDPAPQAADVDAQAPSFDANRPPPADGSLPDTNVPDVDAGAGPVTVNVRKPTGEPIAGATVVFGAANGDVLQTVTSDATGAATALVPAGTMVTIVLGPVDAPKLVTITAIEPGDVILATELVYPTEPNNAIVSLPAPAGPPGASEKYLFRSGPCGVQIDGPASQPPYTYELSPECLGAGRKFSVLTVAANSGFVPTGFQFSKGNVAPTDGGTITPTFGAWDTLFTVQTVNGLNMNVDGGSHVIGFAEIVDGVLSAEHRSVSVQDGGAQAQFNGHPGYAEAAQVEVLAYTNRISGDSVVGTAVRANAPAGSATTNVDFAARLPDITTAGIDGGAPKRPSITWTPASSLAAADGTYVVARWSEAVDAGQVVGTWAFVTPPGATSVTAPVLPASVTAAPGAGAAFSDLPRVVTVEASFVNGYGDFRKGAGALAPSRALLDNFSGMNVPALPVNGTVKYTAFTVNGD